MKSTFAVSAMAAFASMATAQRPSDTSICDYYAKALLKESNATTQQTLLTLLVNTAVIGNYTMPNVGVKVPGILAPGEVNGEKVNLLPYFSGGLASTNTGGDSGMAVNFLDGGGATPLMNNMPANSMNSRQYRLLTHLYQYFAYLLGCSNYGMQNMSPYQGDTSMYEVHKYMGLDNAEVTYFIQQVGLAAASFGVSDDDVKAAGMALTKAFGYRCAPPAAIPSYAKPELQAICIASDCPVAAMPTCAAYEPVMEPKSASPSNMMNMTSTMGGAMPTGSMASGMPSSMGGGMGGGMPTNTGSGMMPSQSVTPYTGGSSMLLPATSSLLVSAGAFAVLFL